MANLDQIANFIADNFESMRVTTLYSGPKTMSGTLTLQDSVENYDLLVVKLLTNSDYFAENIFFNGFDGALFLNNKYSFMKSATTGAGTTYSSTLTLELRPNAPNTVVVVSAYNNPNWILGLTGIIGVKFAGKH